MTAPVRPPPSPSGPPPAAEKRSGSLATGGAAPPGPPEPARQVRSARSARLEYLASEGGLLLLSLMLALMIWFIVRGLVETTDAVTVRVNPIAPPGCQVSVLEDVELRLRGPRGEVEEAVMLLEERGSVKLQVAPFPPDSKSTRRDLDKRDTYLFPPFRKELLDPPPEAPRGEVVRLVQGHFVRVRPPAVASALPADRRARITVEPDHLLLDAPAGVLGDELEPDPLDLKPLLDQPAKAHRIPLTFDRWRTGAGDRPPPPEVLRRRVAVSIRPVTAVVEIEVTATASIANALEIMVKRDWTVVEITPPAGNDDGFAGPLLVNETNPRLDRVNFTGRLRSTQEVLDDLEKHKDGWRWTLTVSDDDLPEPGKPAKEVQARLRFTPVSDRVHELEIQGALQFEPFNVPVKVVSTKR